MALRRLTRVIDLLNKLGHSASRLTILSLETALAQLHADHGDRSTLQEFSSVCRPDTVYFAPKLWMRRDWRLVGMLCYCMLIV